MVQSTTYAVKDCSHATVASHQARADEAMTLEWYGRASHFDPERRGYTLDLVCAGVELDTAVRLMAFAQEPRRAHERYFFIRKRLPPRDYSAECVAAICWMEDRSHLDALEVLAEMASDSREIPFSQLSRESRRAFERRYGRGF